MVEDDSPAGPVLPAGKHLLERPALPQNQPQHQGGVPGWRGYWPGVEVRKEQPGDGYRPDRINSH